MGTTAQLMGVLGQEEVGAGGNELRGVEVAAVGAGGEQGTLATRPSRPWVWPVLSNGLPWGSSG